MKHLFVPLACAMLTAPLTAQRPLDPSAYRVVDLTHTLGRRRVLADGNVEVHARAAGVRADRRRLFLFRVQVQYC
jgi:hypothetical protein